MVEATSIETSPVCLLKVWFVRGPKSCLVLVPGGLGEVPVQDSRGDKFRTSEHFPENLLHEGS